MVIERKYEWLGMLYKNDPAARTIIDKAFALENVTAEWKQELLDHNEQNICAFMGMGCGIPGDSYQYMMKEFEKIDKTEPYDNGLSFGSVTNIEYETSRKGTAIQMRFVIDKGFEDPFVYRIVGFAALENKDGKIGVNKGWRMRPPYPSL